MKPNLFARISLNAKNEYTLYELNESIENNIYNIVQERISQFEETLIFASISELQEYYKKKF